jgi:hypothetical protein
VYLLKAASPTEKPQSDQGFGECSKWHAAGDERQVTRLGDKLVPRTQLVCAATAALVFFAASFSTHAAPQPGAARLRPATIEAFERYVQLTEARNNEELRLGTPFLWVDALPEAERAAAYAALRRGEVKLERRKTRPDGSNSGHEIDCPGGMIHHWEGVVFVPGATLGEALALLQDYDHHAQYYAPDVERSKIERHEGDDFRVFLRFRRHKVITMVLDTEHEVRYAQDSAVRVHSRSSAVRIAEVESPGKSDEREKPPGEDGGFMWRMETWWRIEERDGGVYVQSEVVSLTRNIPAGLGWLIGPFVTSIPRESLTFTLAATRKVIETRRADKGTPQH